MGDLVNKLVEQGFRPPLVLRFPQIIGHRLQLIQTAFDEAIDATDYRGGYQGAYPIKVNQQQRVVAGSP